MTNGGDLAIEEYRRASPTRARIAASARRLLTIPHPGQPNHNGGQLQFGPDGFLYIGTGDGGGAGDPDDTAQDRAACSGKMLRIDPRPTAAPYSSSRRSNPFAGGAGRDEVYSLGLRNPFRFSLRPGLGRRSRGSRSATSARTASRRSTTRPSRGASGANFGWNDFEGFAPFGGADPPGPSRHDRPIKVYSLGGERLRADRRLRGRATRSCRASGAATSTATSAPASCTASSPRSAAPRKDRGARA